MLLRCYHWHIIQGNSFEELVLHSKRIHPDLLLSVLQSFEQNGRIKFVAHTTRSLQNNFWKISNTWETVSQSPLAKGARFSTPQKHVEHHPLCEAQVQTFESGYYAELAFKKSGSEADYYKILGAMLEHLLNGMNASASSWSAIRSDTLTFMICHQIRHINIPLWVLHVCLTHKSTCYDNSFTQGS